MIRITTIEQTRTIEAAADENGVSYAQMMLTAGIAAAEHARRMLQTHFPAGPAGQQADRFRVTVLVGAGNNGGDGLVAGLKLAEMMETAEVRFYLLAERNDEHVQNARAAGLFVAISEDDTDKRVLRNMVASADLLIDALFGIGVRLPIRDEAQKILRQTNRVIEERRTARPDRITINPTQAGQVPRAPRLLVLALDTPSGLDADSGEVDANVIAADETITFIAAKHGLLTFPGATSVGALSVAEIGIPQKLDALQSVTAQLVDAEWVRQQLPKRGPNDHKGTYGKALIVAGSVNYMGAPAYAAAAAVASGTGLVTVAAPGIINATIAAGLREATYLMLPHDMGVIAEKATKMLRDEISKYDALLIGPGIGTEETTAKFLQALFEETDQPRRLPKRNIGFGASTDDADDKTEEKAYTLPPLVLDADALNILAEIDEWWKMLPQNTIITPHPGEMARLADLDSAADVQSQRRTLALDKAAEWNVVLVLKGAHTIVATPDGLSAVLPFKTDALATAGTGDVLAGLIAGFLAQGVDARIAAMLGGYVHGFAGQIAAENISSRSVNASHVLDAIGEALLWLEE